DMFLAGREKLPAGFPVSRRGSEARMGQYAEVWIDLSQFFPRLICIPHLSLLGKWCARVLAGRSCGEACPRRRRRTACFSSFQGVACCDMYDSLENRLEFRLQAVVADHRD